MGGKTYTFASQQATGNIASSRCQEVMEIFAITVDKIGSRPILQEVAVASEGITYVTGFSGSGKSTLLNLIRRDHPHAVLPAPPERQDVPIIDLVGGDLREAMQLLGYVGLGEAYLYLTPYELLSEGQKARFQLAYALDRQPKLLLIDEFLSNLDRITAKVVAYNFQKLCRKRGIQAVVATAHDDLLEPLAPDVLIRLDLNGEHESSVRPVAEPVIPELHGLRVERGTIEDYRALKRFHYFNEEDLGDGEDFETEIHAIRYEGRCIGICVMTAPYPKDWEDIPYFGDINGRLKSITRVIIHPSFRGAGLVKPLIRPETSTVPYIETCSALGLYMPIYLSAGYSKVEVPTNRRTEKREALETRVYELGVQDMSTLHDPKLCKTFVESLRSEQLEQLHELALHLYAENLVNWNLYLRNIVELPALTEAQRHELEALLLDASNELPTEVLLQETVYFPMQGFAVKHC
jgi:ABC-type lipoprotein export system ATPase subunit